MSERTKGSTSVSLEFRLADATTGAAKTALDVTTLKLQYHRPGEAAGTATSLTSLAAATTGWTSYGAREVDATNSPGVYRVDAPNAAFATGADEVVLTVTGTAIQPTSRLIDLVAVNTRDAVRMGLTSLPNAVAGAVGGLPTGDASGRVLLQPTQSGVTIPTVTTTTTATNLTNLPAVPTDWLTAVGVKADAVVKIQAGLSTYTGGDTSGVTTLLTRIPGTIAANGSSFTSIGDTRLANLDATVSSRLATAGYTAPTNADTSGTTTLLARLTSTRAGLLDNLDAAITTRMATFSYTASDNTGIAAIKAKTDNLPASFPTNFPTLVINGSGYVTTSNPATGGSSVTEATLTAYMDTYSTKLANLTGPVALAATALSTAVWTNTKAGYIDAAISGISGGGGGTDPWNITLPGSYAADKAGYIVGNLATQSDLGATIAATPVGIKTGGITTSSYAAGAAPLTAAGITSLSTAVNATKTGVDTINGTGVKLKADGLDLIDVESTTNIPQAISVMLAALSGPVSIDDNGDDTYTLTFKAPGTNTTRISMVTTAAGERLTTTVSPPA